jgi:hypothetical protein
MPVSLAGDVVCAGDITFDLDPLNSGMTNFNLLKPTGYVMHQ